MSLKVTLPEKPNMPFIVPDSAEASVRDVHINWRSPEEQLQVKIERIRDVSAQEPQSIEDIVRAKLKQSIAEQKSYIRKLKFKDEPIPAELTVETIVDNSITYKFKNEKKKVILLTKTEEEFLELLQKYNPK